MQTVVPVANTAVGEQTTAASTSSNKTTHISWTLSWTIIQIISVVFSAIFLFLIIFGGIYFSESRTVGNCPTGCELQTCVDPSRCNNSGPEEDCNDSFACTCGYDVEGCVGRNKTVFVNDWHKHDIGISFLVIGIVGIIISGCSFGLSRQFARFSYGPFSSTSSSYSPENYYGNPNIPNIPVNVNQQTTAPTTVTAPQNNLGNSYPQPYPQPYAQPYTQQVQYAAVPQQTYPPAGGYNTVHQGMPVQGTIIGPTGTQAAQYQSTGTGVIQGTVVYAAV